MKKPLFILLAFLLVIAPVIAQAEMTSGKTTVYYFWRPGCIHCANVESSGILEKVVKDYDINLIKLSTYDTEGRDKFNYFADGFNISVNARGTPLLVIEKNNEYSYLEGDKGGKTTIVDNLEESLKNFKPTPFNQTLNQTSQDKNSVTLGAVIFTALVDSINPCAFGVLIFLMISLLKIGSSKRALKAGLLYSFVVFVVYFLAGFGIFAVIQAFTSVTRFIYLLAGILVLILGLWQFKDILMPHIGPQLRISPKVKPLIERISHKGTLPAIMLLGVLVSLFELPCTGGMYLAILAMMSKQGTFAIGYLLLYNLIFVLPLIVLTLIIYKGTSPETLQRWTSKERTWMKLASGIVMVALGIYILII